jgi:hypothetical protein
MSDVSDHGGGGGGGGKGGGAGGGEVVTEAPKVKAEERNPIHMFSVQFWPYTEPRKMADTNTELHDPQIFGFDVEHLKKEMTVCSVCEKKIACIDCKTCLKAYCIHCGYRLHKDPTKRKHQMSVMQPRVANAMIREAEKSLIFHVDMGKKISHDLGYLVKSMRTAAEARRIQVLVCALKKCINGNIIRL